MSPKATAKRGRRDRPTARKAAARAAGTARRPRASAGSPLPQHYEPELPTLVAAPPHGDGWLHELKLDGYRIGCRIDGDDVRLLSRRGNDWTDRFREIGEAAGRLPVERALLDGEAVVERSDGRTSFEALQDLLAGGARAGLAYFAFDLLHADGEDLSRAPLRDRKAALEQLLARAGGDGVVRYSAHVGDDGAKVFAAACALGAEGIVSKRADQPHQAGRSRAWLKTKCVHRQEFVVGGFTRPDSGDESRIASLLVGDHDARGRLVFAGKVGTGFSGRVARDLRARLDRLARPTSPFDPPPPGWLGRNARWAEPRLVAEVTFTEWTRDGKLRHPSFQGLREDRDPHSVTRERPALDAANGGTRRAGAEDEPGRERARARRAPRATRATSAGSPDARDPRRAHVAGVSISHPERVLFPAIGLTKAGLARFYERIGDWILPHLAGRPLTLVRCPEGLPGECFFMKHSQLWAPPALRRIRIQEKHKLGEYLVVESLAAVVALVQMDILEIHTWNSTADAVERPNRIVIDLDPGPHVAWARVIAGARRVRRVLQAIGLESFVKNTGGVGLHVVVPLSPAHDWSACLELARAVAEAIARDDPASFTTALARSGREDKIFLDYLRNNRTNTSIAAFSTRAKPNAPVSVPLGWDELDPGTPPDRYDVRNVERRLARLRRDPWAAYWTCRQDIPAGAIEALGRLAR